MKKSVKKLWVKALRSGEYEQGKYRLRDRHNKFCCLGVLCNLHAQAHPELAAEQTRKIEYCGKTEVLPIEVIRWAGLNVPNPRVIDFDGICTNIANLNDEGKSFEYIAELIERHL